MHAKRSSSNNLHHRENADRDHQAETQKRSWQPKLTAQPLRSNCVHNLGAKLQMPQLQELFLCVQTFNSLLHIYTSSRNRFIPLVTLKRILSLSLTALMT